MPLAAGPDEKQPPDRSAPTFPRRIGRATGPCTGCAFGGFEWVEGRTPSRNPPTFRIVRGTYSWEAAQRLDIWDRSPLDPPPPGPREFPTSNRCAGLNSRPRSRGSGGPGTAGEGPRGFRLRTRDGVARCGPNVAPPSKAGPGRGGEGPTEFVGQRLSGSPRFGLETIAVSGGSRGRWRCP
jgi:hypothetical protein